MYWKVVSYMIESLLVVKLNALIISRFSMLISSKKLPKVFDANKAQHIRVAYVNTFLIQKKFAIVNISGFTVGRIGLATGLRARNPEVGGRSHIL